MVDEGVTTLPYYAFRYLSKLEEVVLPESLTEIKAYAFADCTGLEKIWIDRNVTKMGNGAFAECSALTIHGIEGSYAQEYATANEIPFSTEIMVYPTSSLTGSVVDESGKGIANVVVTLYDLTTEEIQQILYTDEAGNWSSNEVYIGHTYSVTCFHGDYTIPGSAKRYTIGEEAMNAATVTAQAKTAVEETETTLFTYKVLNGTYCQLTGYTGTDTIVRIPGELDGYTVQSIAASAFKNNKTLTTVVFPETIETMGEGVFNGCIYLTDVRLNYGLTNISANAFLGCTGLKEITIPSTVTAIGDNAFQNCTGLTGIILPEGVKTVGSYAFSGCTALTSVETGATVTTIGGYAFEGCTALTEVTLAEGLLKIRAYAFRNCTALEEIDLPNSVTTISARAFQNCTKLAEVGYPAGWVTTPDYGDSTTYSSYGGDSSRYVSPFEGCTALKKIVIPEGTEKIPCYAFRYMTSLEEVVLPEGLTKIDNLAFDGCSALHTIDLQEGLETIGEFAFWNCDALTEVEMPESLRTISYRAYGECNALTTVILNEGLTTIENDVFRNCTALAAITVPSTVSTINVCTFYGCTALAEVNLPEGLTKIRSYAFENCTALESIDIPDSVTHLSARAFYNCTKLTEVGYPAGWTTTPDYGDSTTYNTYGGDSSRYRSPFEGCTSLKKIVIDDGVTAIPYYAFRYVTSLEEAVLPASLVSIGLFAFDGCTGLHTVDLNEGLETVGSYAFYNCKSLKTVKTPESLKTIETCAYQLCSGLTSVTLNEGLTTIEENAFRECTGLKSIAVPSTVSTIYTGTFYGCTGMTEVTLAEGLTKIRSYAFENCTALKGIDIPDSVTHMSARAFYNCTKLAEVGYPAGWTTTPDYGDSTTYNTYGGDSGRYRSPFEGCTSLKKIVVDEGVTTLPYYAFRYLTALEEAVLPTSLTTLGVFAFDGCTGLKTVNLVEGITAIPAYCFYNCKSLSEVVLPSTVTSVGNHAYYNCIGLRTITMREGLQSIGSYAFYGCDGVLSLVLNDGLQTISDHAFYNCENLKAVEVPSSVETMGSNVFDGCPKLTVYCYSGSKAHMVSEAEGYTIYLLDAHDHEYTISVETVPTCTRGGSQVKTCSICGYYYVDILDALGHAYDDTSHTVFLPTCVEDGYTLHQCTRCDYSYQDTVVPAQGHAYGQWEIVTEAQCVADGSQKRVCQACETEETQTIPAFGHTYEEVTLPSTCTGQGCVVHTCTVCNHAYADTFTPALNHAFGEWAVKQEPTVLECGIRARACTVCGEEETEEIARITIDIANNSQYGFAKFTVLDAVTLEPVSGASIFITTDNDGEATITTDENGKVSQVLPVGKWPVAVYADGYLVRNVQISVKAGEQDVPVIGISDKPLVDAQITTKEMTYEEMIAAGIDVNHEDNKHYYRYEVKIIFHEEIDYMSFVTYGDGEGNIIATRPSIGSGSYTRTENRYALSHEKDAVAAEPVKIVYSSEYGTYIADRSNFKNAVWDPALGSTIAFENNDYYFEGYGIPSTLTMTKDRAFPETGWTYNDSSNILSMSVGARTHYLSYRDGEFCTVSNADDAVDILLFERISAEGYPTEAEYVYVPAETFREDGKYLLVQDESKNLERREALSHDADIIDHETVTIYEDDTYGKYIVDEPKYENAVWAPFRAETVGLKIINNYYYAQVDGGFLQSSPVANEPGWVLDEGYLTTTINDATYYLRYAGGNYTVTTSKNLAGTIRVFEKTTATDVISGSGETVTKTIYRLVETLETGKEYIICGSGRLPSGGGSSVSGGGSGSVSGGGGGGISGVLSDGTTYTVYPVSEKFYLIIYGEVSWIKEMFDVEMLVMNNSSTDTIENCVAELTLPEGLSLATMVEGEQSLIQTIDHIPENGSKSLHWYVRGDKEGTYDIMASLSGTMMPFEDDFYYEYVADSPIKVYAGSAMRMTFHIPEAAYAGKDYTVKIELENVSDKVLYGITHSITGWEQGKITYYSDGREEKLEYGSGGFVGSVGTDAFYPGDKIVIEASFNILFESTIQKNLMDIVDQAETLYNAYEAVKTAYDMLTSITGFVSGASKALDGIVSAGKITDTDKLKATNELLSALKTLYGKFQKGDSAAISLANNIQSSETYKTLKSCATEADWEAFLLAEKAENILELVDKIQSTISEEEANPAESYDAFDALRTMVSTIPIRFVVDSVKISTMERSTTTIPHKVVMTPVESSKMAVDNWSKYLYSLMITTMGKIESPWYAQMFGAPDDITGYDDAVAYVQQVENQIAAYNVRKDSQTQFVAWIERATENDPGITTGDLSKHYKIHTDNETAQMVDGKLHFTGNAVLEVTAISNEGGILCVQDDTGDVKKFAITVIEEHTCHSDEWHVELTPSDKHDGYRVKYCDICGDTIAVDLFKICDTHTFGEWVRKQEPSCGKAGMEVRSCQCGYYETRIVPALEHQYQGEICILCGQSVNVVAAGDTFTATFQAAENTGFTAYTAAIGYDASVMKLISIQEGSLTAGAGSFTADTATGQVQYTGTNNILEDGVLFTATFEVNLDATVGQTHMISAEQIGDTAFRITGTSVTVVPHEHSFGLWTEVKAATCTEKGSQRRTCGECDAFETRDIPMKEHSYSAVVTDPTCTAAGFTTHTCTVCGGSYQDTPTEALGHTGGTATCKDQAVCERCETPYGVLDPNNHVGGTQIKNTKAATCTADGYTGDTHCLGCDTKLSAGAVIPAPGHSFGDWREDTAPTCTKTGLDRRDCVNCDHYETREVPEKGHSYDAVVTAPTCTEKGFTTHTCTVCSDRYVDTYVDAMGHSYVSVVTEPTCTADGFTTHTCSVCGDVVVDSPVAALGHTGGTATCKDPAVCTRCNTPYGEPDGANHTGLTEIRNQVSSTCTQDGYSGDIHCKDCGVLLTEGETIPAGHTYESVVVDATCLEAGYTTHTCTICGDQTVDTPVDALGHSYVHTQVAPSYTKPGCDDYTCARCGDNYQENFTQALGLPTPVVEAYADDATGGGLLTWEDDGEADSYQIYRATSKKGTYRLVATVTDGCEAVVEVSVGKTYYFKVMAVCQADPALSSGYSNIVSVTGKCAQPDVTVEASASSGKPYLTWGKVSSAKKYYIYRSEEGKEEIYLGSTTKTYYTDSKAVVGTAYTYRVRAIGSRSKYNSAYSEAVSCMGVCGQPVVSVSISGETGKPVLSWKVVREAESYRILRRLSGEEEFSPLLVLEELTYTDTEAPLDTDIQYKVIAQGARAELDSAESAVVKVHTTIARPDVEFGNDDATGKPMLRWTAVDGAVEYRVYRSSYSGRSFKEMETTVGTEYIDSSVKVGKGYYYKVVAVGKNCVSDDSDCKKLTAKVAQPVVTAEIVASSGKPYLTWDKVGSASRYTIYRRAENGVEIYLGSTTKNYYTDSDAMVGVTYAYRVRAIGSKSSYSGAYSEEVFCQAVCAQPTLSVSINEETGKPVLSWKPVTGAESYRILRRLSGEEEFVQLLVLEERIYEDTAVAGGIAAEYKVIAQGERPELDSVESEAQKVYTTIARPDVEFGNDEVTGKPVIRWEKVEGAVTYTVFRSNYANKNYTAEITTTDLEYVDPSVSVGKSYYYKVIATGENCASAYSVYGKLYGKCAQPQVTAQAGANGKPYLTWNQVSGAKKYYVYRVNENGGRTSLGSTTRTYFTDSKAAVGIVYTYQVRAAASTSSCDSAYSALVSCLTTLAQPVVNLRAETVTGKPSLEWNAVSGAVYYEIYCSENGGAYKKRATQTELTYTDEAAVIDSEYSYKVIAVAQDPACNAESAARSIYCACPQPVITGGLDGKKPMVEWEPVEGADMYYVYRATSSNGSYKNVATVTDGESYTDSTANRGRNYYYKVVAVSENTQSAMSGYVKIRSK